KMKFQPPLSGVHLIMTGGAVRRRRRDDNTWHRWWMEPIARVLSPGGCNWTFQSDTCGASVFRARPVLPRTEPPTISSTTLTESEIQRTIEPHSRMSYAKVTPYA